MKISKSAKLEIKRQMELDSSIKCLVACVWSKPQHDLRRNSEGKAEWSTHGIEGWKVAIVPALGFDKAKIQEIEGISVYFDENLKIESLNFSNNNWFVNNEQTIPYEKNKF